MNEEKAREILKDYITDDNGLHYSGHYISFEAGSKKITLDRDFEVNELEAIVWWMKNYS